MHGEFHLSENKPLKEYKLPIPLFHVCVADIFNQSLEDLPQSVETVVFLTNNLLPYNTIPHGIVKIVMHTFPCFYKSYVPLNIPLSVKIIEINYLPISVIDYLNNVYHNQNFLDKRKKNIDEIIPVLFQKIPFECVVVNFFNELIFS